MMQTPTASTTIPRPTMLMSSTKELYKAVRQIATLEYQVDKLKEQRKQMVDLLQSLLESS